MKPILISTDLSSYAWLVKETYLKETI